MSEKTYLGDGLYAAFDGYHIWLEAERDGRRHRVALEPEVLRALWDYAKAIGERQATA